MDPKQSLSPDLKQIYDSIMNTPTKTPASSSDSAGAPVVNTAPSSPSPMSQTPTPVEPKVEPPTPISPTEPSTQLTPPTPSPETLPNTNNITSSEQKTVPPPPPTPFVFSSNQPAEKPTPIASNNPTYHVPSATPKLLLLLIPLGIVFLVVYAVFWMALFGLLDLSQFGL